MLDREGFRPNVGIILLNQRNQVFWGKRIRSHSWQFPQGGIDRGETPEQAMYRELHEEVGLMPEVTTRAKSRSGTCCVWLRTTGNSICAPPAIRSLMPGAGMTTGSRWTWWWSSNAAFTKWR